MEPGARKNKAVIYRAHFGDHLFVRAAHFTIIICAAGAHIITQKYPFYSAGMRTKTLGLLLLPGEAHAMYLKNIVHTS